MPEDPTPNAAALVDLDRYPVLDLDGAGSSMVARHAADLRASGVSILIEGDDHAKLTWGPAQAGVAAGVADAVAAGTIAEADAAGLVLIAAVWVDPAARDADLVFANNREATAGALALGRAGLPAAVDVVAQRDAAWNPFYRPA